jgi:cellulose synthase/poly-beta-1,6-N-acetylglucosamine synthase-like glycosyltransferase
MILDWLWTALITVIIIGINTTLWGIISFARWVVQPRALNRHRRDRRAPKRFQDKDVAILMAAHNEEPVLADALRSAASLLPPDQIHVVSDGSSDRTVAIAQELGVNVLDLQPNRGKAGALVAAIDKFDLMNQFKVVMLLDADSRLTSTYLKTALPCFDDPEVVAVSGVVKTITFPPPPTKVGRFILAHRTKVYAVTQQMVKYGQAIPRLNLMPIIPGFASLYRTDILSQIDIARPGLVLEDINMTFEIHTKRLGRIAFDPFIAVAYTQDPDNWHDYAKQLHRWCLGYWQTIRAHYRHFNLFWFSVALQAGELIVSSIVGLMMLPMLFLTVYLDLLAPYWGYPTINGHSIISTIPVHLFLLGFFAPDMLMTIAAVFLARRRDLALLAPLLVFVRIIDSCIVLWSLATALRAKSNGQWKSPTRRGISLGP